MQALDRARQRISEIDSLPELHPHRAGISGYAAGCADPLMEQQHGSLNVAARPQSGKIVLQAQSRLLLIDQKDICYASIDDGTISVVTPTIEGQSNAGH